MKSKNLVSLSVAAVFFVLAITGLLIYFGQGSHVVEHTHAWFGVLFVAAAIFHIMNNWASIVGYSKNRRTGGIQKELVVPVVIVAIFALGIGFDLPVFGKLANFGKGLFKGERPRGGPMEQTKVDSIANAVETAYATAYTKGDTGALAKLLPIKTSLLTEAGTILSGSDIQKNILKRTAPEVVKTKVDRAESLDERTILVYGTSTNSTTTSPTVFSHLLKEQDKKWTIIAAQRAFPAVQ
ncbi:DUF4405 domain-containing protein [Spirosoma pollinicola]|uniref:Flavinylation-associated cytochrome domain-containing protein n=1 Tax=Spirosoma pollinicola TaxID=2057025 RepID=A0A2K8YSB7_9BACT|nr:DUF4405 domain-containing protein [Spirosoma pollinicola]AUD00523.1 hypothetical protein CWM47_01025 [Spirosoma pollinicola]